MMVGRSGTRTMASMAVFGCLVLLLSAPFAGAQSRDTGQINGVVTDEQGGVLPGATVTILREDRGTEHTAVTDARGSYRFPAVRRGTYSVVASMDGFSSAQQDDVRLSTQQTLRVDFRMQLGSVTETVQVTAIPPLMDVQGSELATTQLSNEVLMNVPTGKNIAGIVKLTPGVHNSNPGGRSGTDGRGYSAYGGSDQGIQYAIDGVIINSPEAGEAETPLGFDSLQEINVMGLGAPAEYDGFDGVVVNATTKSGSNDIRGLVDLTFTDDDWVSSNTDDSDLERRGFFSTRQTYHVDVGGPIQADKVWFFGSLRYSLSDAKPDPGFAEGPKDRDSRMIGKVSWQLAEKQHLTGLLEYSKRTEDNIGSDDGGWYTPGTEFRGERTQYFWNLNYTNLLSDNTLFEGKFGGHFQDGTERSQSGDNDTPARFDEFTDHISGNFPFPFNADRERYMVVASLTHYTEEFLGGAHDFKFGGTWESTPVHTYFGTTGGRFYIDQGGEPYLLEQGAGYSTFATPKKFSAYAQDSWDVNEKVRLNLGLRFNRWRGSAAGQKASGGSKVTEGELIDIGTIYKPKNGLAPRIGVTIDMSGDNSAVVKAHWGKYYRQVHALFFSRLAPESDFSLFAWDGEQYVHEFTEVRDETQFTVDPDLRVPFNRQFAVGFEKELAANFSADLTGIYITNHDFMDPLNLTGIWEPVPYTDEFTGKSFTVFNQLNPGENKFLITNVEPGRDYGQAFQPLTDFEQKRTYFGITATLNKRWSNNWQAQGSYTYGRAIGTDDNEFGEFREGRSTGLGGSALYDNPNWQINADGHLTIDPTHLVKVAASTLLFEGPAEVILGTYVNIFTGNPYNQNIPLIDIQPRDQEIWAEPRGSFRNPSGILVDLKIEKLFPIKDSRASAMVDIFNVFNSGVQTDAEQSVDSQRAFGSTTGIVRPRSFRLGFRWRF